MNITKNVIADLYPLYVEKECSEDTRLLVEDYLGVHPQEADELRQIMQARLPASPVPAQSLEEVRSLRRARRRVRQRGWVMGLAIFFSLCPFSVQVDNAKHVHWLFLEAPWQAGCFAAIAALLWTFYIILRKVSPLKTPPGGATFPADSGERRHL